MAVKIGSGIENVARIFQKHNSYNLRMVEMPKFPRLHVGLFEYSSISFTFSSVVQSIPKNKIFKI